MAMGTTKAISAALKLVDSKKENLRKAFEDLQSHSSSLPTFTLTWSDLDSYFTSIQSSLEHKFKLLQSLESQSQPPDKLEPLHSQAVAKPSLEPAVPARPDLIEFCVKMDGIGLRRYMVARVQNMVNIRAELNHALICAPDAAALVLDAMDGFYMPNRNFEMGPTRSCCLALLEQLMELKPAIGVGVKEKAKKVALKWRKNLSLDGENPSEELAFLELVAAYGLQDCFNKDEFINCLVIVSKRRQALTLPKLLNVDLSELIRRLISTKNEVLAVKFIFEFGLVDKFPPAQILKEYLKGVTGIVQEMRNRGKHNDAKMKEKSALKSVIKCIEDFKLETEYPKDTLIKRIENIDNEKEDNKRPAASLAPKPQQQSTIKRARTNEQAGPVSTTTGKVANSAVPSSQPPQGLLPEEYVPQPVASAVPSPKPPQGLFRHNHAPQAVPHSLPESNTVSASVPSTVTMNRPNESQVAGHPMGFSGNPTPNQYPVEAQMPSGYPTYNGYRTEPQTPGRYQNPNRQPTQVQVPSGYPTPNGYPTDPQRLAGYSTPNGYPTEPHAPTGYQNPNGQPTQLQMSSGYPTSNGYPTEPQMPAGYKNPNGQPTQPQVPSSYPTPTGYPTEPQRSAGYPTPNWYPTGPQMPVGYQNLNGQPTQPHMPSSYPTPNGYPTEAQMPAAYQNPNGQPTQPQMRSSYPTPNGYPSEPQRSAGYPTSLPPQYHPSYHPQ